MTIINTPRITRLEVIPVAGRDSMLLNLSGAHGPYFTRNILILTDSAGRSGVGEPVAGVPAGEREDLLKTVAALPADVSVLLIGHDMDLVFSFANRMTVLVNGTVLTEGDPEQIANDPQVKAVYLGHGEEAVHG